MVQMAFLSQLVKIAFNNKVDSQVSATAYGVLKDMENAYVDEMMKSKSQKYLGSYIKKMIKSAESGKGDVELLQSAPLPPGSPIGCGIMH